MKQEEIIKYLLIAAGAYLVYEYVIKPMMASTPAVTGASNTGLLPAGPTNTAPTTTATPPVTTPTAPGPGTEQQIQALSGGATQLTMDQWGWYYNQVKPAIPPATFDRMLAITFDPAWSAASSDGQAALRGSPVTLHQFMVALNGAGLSGIVPAFSQLPPSMTFGKGFSSGFGTKRGSRSTSMSQVVN